MAEPASSFPEDVAPPDPFSEVPSSRAVSLPLKGLRKVDHAAEVRGARGDGGGGDQRSALEGHAAGDAGAEQAAAGPAHSGDARAGARARDGRAPGAADEAGEHAARRHDRKRRDQRLQVRPPLRHDRLEVPASLTDTKMGANLAAAQSPPVAARDRLADGVTLHGAPLLEREERGACLVDGLPCGALRAVQRRARSRRRRGR